MTDNNATPEATDATATTAAASADTTGADNSAPGAVTDPGSPNPGSANAGSPDAIVGDSVGEDLNDTIAELTSDLQRISAEFTNYRRRVDRDLSMAKENGKASVLNSFIAIADDVDRAADHGDLVDGSALKAFCDKFMAALQSNNVTPFGVEGDSFDANFHEAIKDEGGDGDKVLSAVLRKGYRAGDRILRHAMVVVCGDESQAGESAPVDTEVDAPESYTAEETDG